MAGPDSKDIRNAGIILFVVTLLVTSYRCFARYTKKLWWYDDSVALFSALSFIFFPIGYTFIIDESSSQARKVLGCYLVVVGYYTPIWGARISIVFTVIRITPWESQRKILIWVAVFFFLQFAMLTVQVYWVCELSYAGWKHIPGSVCVLPEVVPISQVVTAVISDAILVIAPLTIVRGVHIRALRFRLFSIFSVSIATTVASLAHAVLVMTSPGFWEGIFGCVEVAVSVIVCNMSVIIPAVLRALGVGDPFMQEDTVEPNPSTGVDVTRMSSARVEFGLPTPRGTAITDSDDYEGGVIDTMVHQQGGPIDFGVKDDRKHQLTTQVSVASLRNSKSKVVPLADESKTTDSSVRARGFPTV